MPTKEEGRGRAERAGSTEQRASVFEKGLQGATAIPAAPARGVSWQQAGVRLWNVNEAGCWQGTAAAAEPSSLPQENTVQHRPFSSWWSSRGDGHISRTHTAHSPRYSQLGDSQNSHSFSGLEAMFTRLCCWGAQKSVESTNGCALSCEAVNL